MATPNANAAGGPFGEDDDIGVLWIRKLRTFNALARADVHRISDLLRMTDKQILATPGIGAASLADIRGALEKFISDELDALRAGSPPATVPARTPRASERHPIDIAIDALRAAAESVPDDGYSGWRASFHRMADALPDREYRERNWGEED